MNPGRGRKETGQGLQYPHQQELLDFHEWMKGNPEAAGIVISECAKVLMLAKCLKVSADDDYFYSECAALVTLSFTYGGVTRFFEMLFSIDLANHQTDRMVDPAMLGLIKERTNRLMCRMGNAKKSAKAPYENDRF